MSRLTFEPVSVSNEVQLMHLYALLQERTPEQSISHRELPTFEQHRKFVGSCPYLVWYVFGNCADYIGSIYLTRQREIGVAVHSAFRRRGYAIEAIRWLAALHPGPFYANVNPKNEASIELWRGLGFRLIQYTYALEP